MTTHRKWVLAYFVFFVLMVIANYTAGQMGSDVGGAANQNETIIQPAGFHFSIWGLIYTLHFICIIFLFFSTEFWSYITAHLTFWPSANYILNGLWVLVVALQYHI